MADGPDRQGIFLVPPAYSLVFLVFGYLAEGYLPPGPIGSPSFAVIGTVLAAAGVALAAGCWWRFRRAGTSVETFRPSVCLVTDGPYRYSRNPIYLGLLSAHVGVALIAGSAWMLASALPMYAVLRYHVIAREERYLAGRFGAAYLAYAATTRRWL